MPNIIYNRRLNAPTGVVYDAATTAWVNAVVGAGGSVSDTQKSRVDALILSLKAHSLWTIQDRIWLHASENEQQATIDIVNLGVATKTGSLSFTASQGYTGDGSTGYLNTGFANGTNFTRDDGGISTYVRNSRTANNNGMAIGAADLAGTGAQSLIMPKAGNNLNHDLNNLQFSAQTANTVDAQGFWTNVRTGASAQAIYKNSNSTAYGTAAASSLAITNNIIFYIFARNNNGTADFFSSDQIAITAIGAGMTNGTNVAQFQTDLNSYMTSLGTNIY